MAGRMASHGSVPIAQATTAPAASHRAARQSRRARWRIGWPPSRTLPLPRIRICRQRLDVRSRPCFAPRELPQRRAIPAELGMRLPRLLALREAAIEAPVGPERLYYLVEIVGQTKNAPCGQIGPALLEVVQDGRRPWHLEANHDCGQGSEIVRILVEVGLHDVTVE